MTDYVRRGGLDVSPPPWRCEDIHTTIFYVKADLAALQALCDRTLNQPSGSGHGYPPSTRLRYEPLVDWVAFTFQSFNGLHSTAAPDPGSSIRERHAYSEAAIWVMVDKGDGLEVMIPYMFIDDGTCMAAGREIYGFPKEHAAVAIPARTHAPDVFSVQALAVPTGNVASRQNVLKCSRKDSAPLPLALAAQFLDENLGNDVIAAIKVLYAAFIAKRLDFAFLRQFRALGGGPGAELQQVVAAAADPFDIDPLSISILRDYELHLPDLVSHPIGADLGLAPGRPVEIPFGLQCDAKFVLQPGRVL